MNGAGETASERAGRRYAPEIPLPNCAYIPRTGMIHPRAGGAKATVGRGPIDCSRETWSECPEYLHGIDLFNAEFYWEAHEAWEFAWNALGRTGPEADFLKALIKLAAAGVKDREGAPAGVKTHSTRAGAIFERLLEGDTCFFGLETARLRDLAREIAESGWPSDPIRLELTFPKRDRLDG